MDNVPNFSSIDYNCFSQIPNTPCINPDYIPIGIRMPEDDEYFYVRKNETSPVSRYKKTLT